MGASLGGEVETDDAVGGVLAELQRVAADLVNAEAFVGLIDDTVGAAAPDPPDPEMRPEVVAGVPPTSNVTVRSPAVRREPPLVPGYRQTSWEQVALTMSQVRPPTVTLF